MVGPIEEAIEKAKAMKDA